jgi:hypothetical protein
VSTCAVACMASQRVYAFILVQAAAAAAATAVAPQTRVSHGTWPPVALKCTMLLSRQLLCNHVKLAKSAGHVCCPLALHACSLPADALQLPQVCHQQEMPAADVAAVHCASPATHAMIYMMLLLPQVHWVPQADHQHWPRRVSGQQQRTRQLGAVGSKQDRRPSAGPERLPVNSR